MPRIAETHPFQILIYEGNGAAELAAPFRFQLCAQLLDKGYNVRRITRSGRWTDSPPSCDHLLILGDFGGGAPDLEDAGGSISLVARDISGLDPEVAVALVEDHRSGLDQPLNQPGAKGAWKPWFPVIDYDRCTNCMQCLSFCLFDVYGVDEQKNIQVRNNDNCKTNCPACSRVCPEVAIMFPKYSAGPINGDAINEQDVDREKMKVDISSLLGGDIYASLRNRSEAAKSRFSKERSPDKALAERKRCLLKLQQSGLIPPEVLAELDLSSLPTPDEIRERARAAAENAKKALDGP